MFLVIHIGNEHLFDHGLDKLASLYTVLMIMFSLMEQLKIHPTFSNISIFRMLKALNLINRLLESYPWISFLVIIFATLWAYNSITAFLSSLYFLQFTFDFPLTASIQLQTSLFTNCCCIHVCIVWIYSNLVFHV